MAASVTRTNQTPAGSVKSPLGSTRPKGQDVGMCPRCGGMLGPATGLLSKGWVCTDCHFGWTTNELRTGSQESVKPGIFKEAPLAGDAETRFAVGGLVLAALVLGLVVGAIWASDPTRNAELFVTSLVLM